MLIFLEYYETPKSGSNKINGLALFFFCLKCPFSFGGSKTLSFKARTR